MTVAAVAIVRDEARILERMVDSCQARVDDIVVVDTGSTDDTPELAAELGCTVHRRAWRDFGSNRTEALQLARGHGDYLLLLDADDELLTLTANPVALAYSLQVIHPGCDPYLHPRLVSTRVEWKYVGVTHEYLTSDAVPVPAMGAPLGGSLLHHCDGARQGRKLVEDAILLEDAHRRDPENVRTVFYLANTYRDLGDPDRALPLYRLRARMGGWQAEADAAAEQAERLEAGNLIPVAVPC